ncbi:hypothetical protein CRUP_019585, partial [Coryphaenoides rupestris]
MSWIYGVCEIKTMALVILMLTKYFDFTTGRVTESSLWRSTDYGTTYEKLNERVGLKTVLSYLYVSPNNKRKIMLLTDPEVESSLLISGDEGASYQRHGLGFDILSLLFHPEQEDWILAYSHDQKVCFTCEDAPDNYECNRWAPDLYCPREARYCYSRHTMNIDGDSVSVTKRCVALEDCLSTGCTGTDHEGNK